MLKYLNDLDIKKTNLNNLAMLPGFNIIEQAKTNETYKNDILNNDTFNNDTSNKTIISENIFSKLYGLIDNVKKQLTRKNHKKTQGEAQASKATQKQAIKVNAIKASKATTSTNRKHAKAENTNKSRKKSA
jgi:hypothetical protein